MKKSHRSIIESLQKPSAPTSMLRDTMMVELSIYLNIVSRVLTQSRHLPFIGPPAAERVGQHYLQVATAAAILEQCWTSDSKIDDVLLLFLCLLAFFCFQIFWWWIDQNYSRLLDLTCSQYAALHWYCSHQETLDLSLKNQSDGKIGPCCQSSPYKPLTFQREADMSWHL